MQIQVYGRQVERWPELGQAREGLDFGGEREYARGLKVVERLDTDPVPGQEESAARLVPDREGEHSAKPLDTTLAPLLVGVDDCLGVGMRLEAVPLPFQLVPQVGEVVYLAVER